LNTLYVLVTAARMRAAELRANMAAHVFTVIQPIVLLLITLVPADQSPERVARTVFGVLLMAYWTATVWGAASVLRADRAQGTLARTLTAGRDPRLVVVGKGLGTSVLALSRVSVVMAVTVLLLGKPIALARPDLILVGLLAVVASGTALGLMIGSTFVATRYAPQISSALMYPVFLLGGMLIPPESLPWTVRWVSSLVSLRWLQQFLAESAAGHANWTALLNALVLTGGYALIGVWLFRRMVTRARRDATLELL
jgi:ABC-2 type transport system permease protein